MAKPQQQASGAQPDEAAQAQAQAQAAAEAAAKAEAEAHRVAAEQAQAQAAAEAARAESLKADGFEEVTIIRGTFTDVVDGKPKAFGPGSVITVSAADAEMLRSREMVQPIGYIPPEEVQDGTLKVLAEDGPTVQVV